jgi:RNA polymerase sigma-70 factor (ECF subfamily)
VDETRPHTAAASAPGADDAALVRAAAAGDRRAFAAIYGRYARAVHGVLLARVPRADADDLTQEVFVAAMRKIGDLREPAAVGAWLTAAARNRAATWIRGRATTPRLVMADEPSSHPSPPAALDPALVMEHIAALPEAYRETLVLRLVEGLTGPQIAAATGMTHGSVRVNLHKGMEMLRARLVEVRP